MHIDKLYSWNFSIFINDSQAAIVLVSHDEAFVKQTATQSFIIQDQNWIDYLTYDDYFDINVTN